MARRGNTNESTSTETPEVTDETTETPTETPTEAPVAEVKVEEKPVDLTDFRAAAEAAVTEMDESTGELPVESIAKVNEAYRAIDGVKGKNQARGWVEDQMKAAITSKPPSIQQARAYVMLKDGLSAGSSSSASKAPADPTTAFVQKVVALNIALAQVTSSVPEGVSSDWAEKADEFESSLTEQVSDYVAWQASTDEDAEAPEVSPVVRQAFKLSQGKTPGGSGRVSGGPRRDIEKHLIQVFEGLEVGDFLTVNEIAKQASTEYGDDRPSAGAVSARLFPKGKDSYEANGIKAVNSDDKARGAEKVA